MRIDLWLWAVRLTKTRQDAVSLCRGGKVKMNGATVKPSKQIEEGERITIRSEGINRIYEISGLLKKRVGAKLVNDYRKEVTPQEELEKLELNRKNNPIAQYKGKGRPTKKIRREIDKIRGFNDIL